VSWETKAFLRDAGDVLAVDPDTPRLGVVEPQEQVDHRRLAGPRGADEADLFARRDGQRQVVEDAAVLAVVKAHMLEGDAALSNHQRPRRRPVDQAVFAGDGLEPVLHRADVLEKGGQLPHDPVGHALQAQDQPDGERDRPGGHGVLCP
jgi:hypothetical protein